MLDNYHFWRQYSIGPYILDFYCPSLRFAIELDGKQHGVEDAIAYDNERTMYLNNLDIFVLRFTNEDLMKNIDTIIAKIKTRFPLIRKGDRGGY